MSDYRPPTWKTDLADLGVMLLAVAIVMVISVAGFWYSHWFAEALYRAGFHGSPTEWIAHGIGFVVTVGVVLTLAGRILNGNFWWRT